MSTLEFSHGRIALPAPKSNEIDSAVSTEAELMENVLQFLDEQAKQQGIDVAFHSDKIIYSDGGLILVPVTWKTNLTMREETEKMLALEDAWNDREPPPLRSVHLVDIWNPEISLRSTPPPLNQTV